MSRCNQEVYEHGTTIAVVASVATEVMEAWCQMIAKDSGQKVDWHFVGGRAVVKALGNLEEVDSYAYWCVIRDGKLDTMNLDGELRGFGGAKSCYGYHPGGHNHWSVHIEESSNDRTPDSGSGNEGLTPSSSTNESEM